jgi:hypothetical protein
VSSVQDPEAIAKAGLSRGAWNGSREQIAVSRQALRRRVPGDALDESVVGAGPVVTVFRDILGPPKVSQGHITVWVSAGGPL